MRELDAGEFLGFLLASGVSCGTEEDDNLEIEKISSKRPRRGGPAEEENLDKNRSLLKTAAQAAARPMCQRRPSAKPGQAVAGHSSCCTQGREPCPLPLHWVVKSPPNACWSEVSMEIL